MSSKGMIFIGLLTHKQKQANYFVSQDEDFIYLFHGKNTDKPDCIAAFLYETTTVKEIRDMAEADMVKVEWIRQKLEYMKSQYEEE